MEEWKWGRVNVTMVSMSSEASEGSRRADLGVRPKGRSGVGVQPLIQPSINIKCQEKEFYQLCLFYVKGHHSITPFNTNKITD